MVYKDFYHLMLEYFAQPVELFTSAKKMPFTLYAEEQKLFFRNGKNNISRIPLHHISTLNNAIT